MSRTNVKTDAERLSSAVERIAGTLSRWDGLLPERVAIDWDKTPAAVWREDALGGYLAPVESFPKIRLDDLKGIDRQRDQLVANTRQFLHRFPANNVLLTGSRGAGKSSLVQALLNSFFGSGLRLLQVEKTHLGRLAELCRAVEHEPYRFVLFCDDLSFDESDDGYKVLKSLLEGSLERPGGNCLVYATSNRRHLLPERHSDNAATRIQDGELHEGEAVEEKISLSDRFGLWLSFYPMRQEAFLVTVRHWIERLLLEHDAQEHLPAELDDDRCPVLLEALAWARGRGHRSGRAAYHFASHWVGLELLKQVDRDGS